MMFGDIVQKTGFPWKVLIQQKKIKYVENHFRPSPSYQTLLYTSCRQRDPKVQKTLMFQSSWLDQYNWLVYSASDAGGYCKFLCDCFRLKNSRLSNAVLVNRHFQKFTKSQRQGGCAWTGMDSKIITKSYVTECKLFFARHSDNLKTMLTPF